MASDATLESFAVATESGGFCELDSNSLPDPSGLAFTALQVVRADFFNDPEERVNTMDLTRANYGEIPLEPIGVINNTGVAKFGAADGEMLRAFKPTDISVTFRINNIGDGTAFATHAALPWVKLLRSSMDILTPGAATDDVDGAPADAHTTTATTIGNWAVGMGGRVIRNNKAEDNFVASIAGSVITWAFDWPGGILSDGDTIRLCSTLYPVFGTTPDTVAVRFDMDSRRMYAFGCRVSNPTFDLDDDGALTCTCVIRPAVILRDDANAAVATAEIPDGHVVNQFGAKKYYTQDIRGASAAGLNITALELRSWGFSLELTITPEEGGSALDGVVGATNQLIQGAFPRVTITGQPFAALEDMLRKREARGFVLGYGPAGTGEGLAVALMSGTRNNASMGITKVNGQQMLTTVLQGDAWAFDGSSANAGNTEWRIALPS